MKFAIKDGWDFDSGIYQQDSRYIFQFQSLAPEVYTRLS